MRAAALLALLSVAACTGAPAVAPSPATPAATAASAAAATPSPTPSPAPPSPSAKASPVEATTYTADDEEIARLIRAGADEAIPQLKGLNDSDPSSLEGLFLPLLDWITSQKEGVAALTPTTCTAEAVALFNKGIDQYDAIRKKFLAWRDWGAQGHAFPVAAPGQAVKTLESALTELDATCAE